MVRKPAVNTLYLLCFAKQMISSRPNPDPNLSFLFFSSPPHPPLTPTLLPHPPSSLPSELEEHWFCAADSRGRCTVLNILLQALTNSPLLPETVYCTWIDSFFHYFFLFFFLCAFQRWRCGRRSIDLQCHIHASPCSRLSIIRRFSPIGWGSSWWSPRTEVTWIICIFNVQDRSISIDFDTCPWYPRVLGGVTCLCHVFGCCEGCLEVSEARVDDEWKSKFTCSFCLWMCRYCHGIIVFEQRNNFKTSCLTTATTPFLMKSAF